jgi:hypothetical protein
MKLYQEGIIPRFCTRRQSSRIGPRQSRRLHNFELLNDDRAIVNICHRLAVHDRMNVYSIDELMPFTSTLLAAEENRRVIAQQKAGPQARIRLVWFVKTSQIWAVLRW